MAKRKVNYNTAVDRIKKAVANHCDNSHMPDDQIQEILDVIEGQRRTSKTQTIPPPPSDPPGGKNP